MKSKLGAGYASKTQPRRRWLPRLSRRARIAALVVAVGVFGWLVYSEVHAQIRVAGLRRFQEELAGDGSRELQAEASYLQPITALIRSLSRWQVWRLAHSAHHRLPYGALSPAQRQLFVEALTLKWNSTPPLTVPTARSLGWRRAGMRPAYLYVSRADGRSRSAIIGVACVTYRGPGIRGEAGGTIEIPR